MPNTYTQIHIHTVFSVQNRMSLIDRDWQSRLYQYIVAVIEKREHKVLIIGGMSDHIHILFGFRPTQALSELMQEVKRDSSEWINKQKLVAGLFAWQSGYGAFSYSKSQLPAVIKYIKTQEQHHRKTSFADEYRKILNKFGVDYNDKYIFHSLT